MSTGSQQQFIQYLQNELEVSGEEIDLAMRCQEPLLGQLHMVLWQHGLINLEQLGKAFEWLVTKKVETATSL